MVTDSDPEEEEEEEEFASGESYYSTIRSLFKYEEEFNTDNDEASYTQDYDAKCSNIIQTHFSGTAFINRCYRIAKYINDIKEKKENIDERCKYLNYLLNSNTKLNTFSNHNGSKLFKAYKDIATNMKTCYLIIDYIPKTDFKKIEMLYDLNKAMENLENSIKSDEGSIYNNAENFAELYRKTRNDCSFDNSDGYCSELKVFEQYVYGCMKSKTHVKAWKSLKTLVPNEGTSIIVFCILILGIPFFLYILFKFTPLGSWANIQLQKKKKFWDNISENDQHLESLRYKEINKENSKFSIKYHSAENS
ncbi:PIR Superfamily Protein [Plasmodium ovale curtisi]|uniref:PIR Superfamily Protein n=1 Tax=Plasmodium ovale curtisi TaxID=864141 RepID=A0A1A8XG78_PLAOA|nr:PIR Superfamily Protein [Plasmodium ovale curtisi]